MIRLFRFYLDEFRARPFELVFIATTAVAAIAIIALAWHAAMGGTGWWQE